MVDTAKLRGERLAEFERDRVESNRRYTHAFDVVLSHTPAAELLEFWKLFTSSARASMHIDLGEGTTSGITEDPSLMHVNPMMMKGSNGQEQVAKSKGAESKGAQATEGDSWSAITTARKESKFGHANPMKREQQMMHSASVDDAVVGVSEMAL